MGQRPNVSGASGGSLFRLSAVRGLSRLIRRTLLETAAVPFGERLFGEMQIPPFSGLMSPGGAPGFFETRSRFDILSHG